MPRDPSGINGIKSKGMWAKRKGKALVSHNEDYASYTMGDVLPIPDYKVVL